MPWENIGDVETGNMPEEEDWIVFCLNLAKKYVEFVCGPVPDGNKLDIMWHDHDFGSYPSLGVWYEYGLPDTYVGDCERAMEAFSESIDWFKLKEHFEDHIFSDEEDWGEDE